MSERDLELYKEHFGEPTLEGLKEILDSDKLDDELKIVCVRGWLKLFKAQLLHLGGLKNG